MLPVVLRPDPRRAWIAVPTILLAVGTAVFLVLLALSLAGPPPGWRLDTPGHYATPVILLPAALAFLRLAYVRRTVLTLGEDELSLRQPLGDWGVRYDQLVSVTVRSVLDVGYRNGSMPGVRLRLRDGSARGIPDVFTPKRREVAAMIEARRRPFIHAPSGTSSPPRTSASRT